MSTVSAPRSSGSPDPPARITGRRPADGPVLVVDAGSHSLSLAVFAPDGRRVARRDVAEAPGEHVEDTLRRFLDGALEVTAVGHRVVHGGPRLTAHSVVDDQVRRALQDAAALAPLHVPPALRTMDAARHTLPDVPHVACLDTVFHASLPPAAHTYPLPERWRQYGVRRYGFHGLSYTWALERCADLLDAPVSALQVVLAHLGGGCSATAVRDGRSVDTTMGFTPLEGLMMSRRGGSVDPGALTWLQLHHGLTATEIEDALNHESGLLGLSGTSDDTRDLVRARAAGDRRAALALDVFVHRCRSGIAAMAASLDRLDALVFTGEIGEDQPEVRAEVCAGLPTLGLTGALRVPPGGVPADGAELVSPPDVRPWVIVVPTGEAAQVAVETRRAVRAA